MRPPLLYMMIFQKGERLGELLIRPFQSFADRETSSGFLLLFVTATAIVWVNSSYGHIYEEIFHTHFMVGFAGFSIDQTLHFWINDGLMTIFFFVVGLEIKREVLVGELNSFRLAALPIAGAIGGMVAPALIYVGFNLGGEALHGWGVPMATDIAFTLGALSLLGSRIPHALTVFVVALAIVDDLGAVLVIALFYTSDLSPFYVQLSGAFLAVLIVFNILGFRSPIPYIIVGFALWVAVSQSGVHATVAGVLLALTIPARSRYDTDAFLEKSNQVLHEFDCAGSCGYSINTNEDHQAAVHTLKAMCHNVMPPLHRLEYTLHVPVAFLIIPLFGLANAGVAVDMRTVISELTAPVSLGIIGGLFLGKQLGIFAAVWVAVKFGLADLPRGADKMQVYGCAILCGIGFTMSLFIANLAFTDPAVLNAAKIAVFAGSLLSCLIGMSALYRAPKPERS